MTITSISGSSTAAVAQQLNQQAATGPDGTAQPAKAHHHHHKSQAAPTSTASVPASTSTSTTSSLLDVTT